MIVYGDPQRVESTREALAALRGLARDSLSASSSSPTARDEAAARLLIASGELAQGLLDAAFEARGGDDWGDLEEACAVLSVASARTPPAIAMLNESLERLERLELPESVWIRVPEGFAFYALDPSLYRASARSFRGSLARPPVVVGIRSIGTSLAAVVALAAGAKGLPMTIRPVGHPFRRGLRLGPTLEARLLDHPRGTPFAIVDEGPGFSGSSFGAVADWLEDHAIAPELIHFFPGHAGDLGPEACARHRARWQRAGRHVVEFEDVRRARFPGASYFEDDPGAVESPVEEISGGLWRAKHYRSEAAWPPAHCFQERRKYLYSFKGSTRLAKFVGLGRHGDEKLARARLLARAGWVNPPIGLRRGFLIEPWRDDARPGPALDPSRRPALLDTVAGYLAFRARTFPAPNPTAGATPEQLFAMIRVNLGERFTPEVAGSLEPWRAHLPALVRRIRRVITDNRMHAWEWLGLPDGRWIKADALDHAEAHDLIGAQDLSWDVAGACVELDLSAEERRQLEERLARASPYRPDPLLLGFHALGYLAFQMGYHVMAGSALAFDPEEAARHAAAADRYAGRLEALLDAGIASDGGRHSF
jgi:hypothetical protein